METRAHYVAVGAFVLAMLFLAFVAVLWLAGTQFTTSFSHYDIYFEGPVTGLSNGARVEYNGIPVGTVSDIEIVADPEVLASNGRKQIRVTIEIKSTVDIKKDDAATIQTNILSGVSYILVQPGKSTELLEARKGERYPVIRSRRSTLSSITARGPQLLDKLDDIFDHIEDILNEDNRKNFAAILDNIQKVTHDVADHSSAIAVDADNALKDASTLLTHLDTSYSGPDGLKDKLSTALDKASGTLDKGSVAVVDFDKLVVGLGNTNKNLDGAISDLRPGLRNFSQHTIGDVDSLIAEFRQFVSGLSRLSSQLERDPTRLLFGDRREGYQPK
jgi:phospholipid/cholesterol/gamma-HCH transport system substrate-binding protein